MIPNLLETARELRLNPSVVALVIAGALTAIVLFAQSIARWFDDGNS